MNTDFSSMKTEELMEKFVNSCLFVDKKCVEEIMKREESPDCLLDILKEDEYWKPGGKGDAWSPIHSIFVLGLIGDNNALEALKYALKNRVEELDDWITEDVPRILFAFGKDCFGKIKEIALDATYDMYVRLAAIDAICALSVINDELMPQAAEACKTFLEDENDKLVSLALPNVAEVKDDGLFEIIKKNFNARRYAKQVTDMQDLEDIHRGASAIKEHEHCTETLWSHFSEENLNMLGGINCDTDMTTVKCSACGDEMDCPKSTAQAENHTCHICTGNLASGANKDAAKEMAKTARDMERHKKEMLELGEFIHETSIRNSMPKKNEAKGMSKKDIAETMHFTGVMNAIDFFMCTALNGRMLKEILSIVEASKRYDPKNDENLKSFVHETEKVMDVAGTVVGKLQKMGIGKSEFERLVKSIDPKAFDSIRENPDTEEGLAIIMNRLIFGGDWTPQLKWTKKNGTKEDVEAVRRGMIAHKKV